MRIGPAGMLLALLFGAAGPGVFAQSTSRALYVAFSPSTQHQARIKTEGPGGTTGERHAVYRAQGTAGAALEFAQRFGRWFGYTAHLSTVTEEFTRYEHDRVFDPVTTTTISETLSEASDETMFVPLFGVFDIHLLPPGRFDLHAGPLLGYIWYDSMYGAKLDDHFIYGLGAGLDVGLGGPWAISGAVRFVQVEAEFREATGSLKGIGEINIDPWQVQIGVAYRFDKTGP